MGIIKALTNKIKSSLLQTVVQPSWMLSPYTHPSHGLTPNDLKSIFEAADAGDISQQSEFFMEIEEKDLHLGSVLQTRKLAVCGLSYEITPKTSDPQEKKIADWLKEALSYIKNLDEAMLDLMDAVGKGFAISEIMYDYSEGNIWINELQSIEQRRFTFIDPVNQNLVLDYPRLLSDNDPFHGEEIQRNKFAFFRHKARAGIVTRGGLLRVCGYIYLFKNYTIKDWLIGNERFSQPMRLGKYKQGASESDIRVLKQAVASLGVDAAAVISENTMIELIESNFSGKATYEALADYCDRQFSKGVLGQTLTTESGPTGSLALGQVQNEVRHDLLKFDARALARAIKFQILAPLVEFNFGPEAPVPDLVFKVEDSEDLEKLANVYSVLKNSLGLPISEAHIYDRFGVPIPEEGAKLLPATEHPSPSNQGGARALPLPASFFAAKGSETGRWGDGETGQGNVIQSTSLPIPLSSYPDLEKLKSLMADGWKEIMAPLIDPIIQMASSSHSLEELRGRIVSAFSDMDQSVLQGVVTRGMFLAEVMGYVEASNA